MKAAEAEKVYESYEALWTFVNDVLHNGLSADLNPTMMFGGTEQQMYSQFVFYLKRLDDGLREQAAKAMLNAAAPHLTH